MAEKPFNPDDAVFMNNGNGVLTDAEIHAAVDALNNNEPLPAPTLPRATKQTNKTRDRENSDFEELGSATGDVEMDKFADEFSKDANREEWEQPEGEEARTADDDDAGENAELLEAAVELLEIDEDQAKVLLEAGLLEAMMEKVQQAAEATQQAPPPKTPPVEVLDEDLKAIEEDEYLSDNAKKFLKKLHQRDQQREQERFAEKRARIHEQIEESFEHLPAEIVQLVGSGPSSDYSPKDREFKNRQKVGQTLSILAAGYVQSGKPAPPIRKLLADAARIALADQLKGTERGTIAKTVKDRTKQFLAPTGSASRKAHQTPEQRAYEANLKVMRKWKK